MATPIIQSSGSVSGAGAAGTGRNDLVPGETVTLSDAEGANGGATYFWEFDDTPIGTSPTLLNPTTATPSFVVNPDELLAGSYRVRCTVNGTAISVEVLAVPLAVTGARIPSFEEETQYDSAGNVKGWHEAMTVFMRSVDAYLGDVGASANERSASVVVPNGTSSVELELGSAIYLGSLIAIAGRSSEELTGGSISISARVGGVTKFTATLNLGAPTTAFSVQSAGTYPIVQGDRISILVAAAGLVTASGDPVALSINLVLSNSLDTNVLTIPDASNTQKGLTKLSVAPAVATEPVAVGTNDDRVPTQDENNALAGTSGTPSATNKYVTDEDPRLDGLGGGGSGGGFDDFITNATYFDDFLNNGRVTMTGTNPADVKIASGAAQGYRCGIVQMQATAAGDVSAFWTQYSTNISPDAGQSTIRLGGGSLVWQTRASLGALITLAQESDLFVGGASGMFGFAIRPSLYGSLNWHTYGTNNGPTNTGIAQDTDIHTFRFEHDSATDTARWYIDGVLVITEVGAGLNSATMAWGVYLDNLNAIDGAVIFVDYFAMTYATTRS